MGDVLAQIYTMLMGGALIFTHKLFADRRWLQFGIILSGVGLVGLGLGGLLGYVE